MGKRSKTSRVTDAQDALLRARGREVLHGNWVRYSVHAGAKFHPEKRTRREGRAEIARERFARA